MRDKKDLLERLKHYNILSAETYLNEAFNRNIGIFSKNEQKKLFDAKIAIPGMGGVGGVHLLTMLRTGIGNFHISDFDHYEPVNINRQVGASVSSFGRSKLEVMTEQALSINPFVQVNSFPEGICENNLDQFLDGVDVVLDSLDFFAFDIRRALFNRAREKGIYVITAGPLGFSSALLVFSPYDGTGFDEYFDIHKGMTPEEKYLAFAMGLAPKAIQFKYMDTSKVCLESRKGPSLNIACQLCSAMAGTEAVKIILGRGKLKPVPFYIQFDPYTHTHVCKKLRGGNRNPFQKTKSFIVKNMLKKNKGLEIQDKPNLPIRNSDNPTLSEEELDYLLRSGIQAPSGDNAQPWKFKQHGNKITIMLNPDADDSFFNFQDIASAISCGAVIENITLAASCLGLKTRVIPFLKNSNRHGGGMADLFFERTGCMGDPLAAHIWSRKTNRKLFKSKTMSDTVLSYLRHAAMEIPGIDIHFITDSSDLKRLAKLVYRADSIRTEHMGLHRHLMDMIRFSVSEANLTRNGFYIKNLEAGPAGELFLKLTRKWAVMKWANRLGLGKMVALNAYNGILHSSGAALITCSGMDMEDFVRGGRALERFWLALTRMGYQVQPMTAITLFFLRQHIEGDVHFTAPQARMLHHLKKEYAELFRNCDFSQNGQVMLLRFGHSDDINYPTLRKKPEAFISGKD